MSLPSGNSRPADTPQARQYNRLRRRLNLADLALGFAFLVALLAFGWSGALRDLAIRTAGEGRYTLALAVYVVLFVALTKALGAPFDLYSFRLERRFRLSTQSFDSWLRDQLKGWLLNLALVMAVVQLVYFTIRLWPLYWWVAAWAVFIVLSVVLAQLAPVLLFPIFYKFKPLQDEELRKRLTRLSQRAGTRIRGVYEWKLSEKSNKANAALAGLGSTRRIILADTLLEKYTADEIEAVMAHELGHHVHRHMPKGIALHMAVTFVGFWAADFVLRYAIAARGMFGGLADFANLPLLALVSSALSLLVMPALNAYSRYNERQADRYAWQAIPSVEPYITAMNKLADQNLAERSPARWVEVLFHSHPPIAKRVAAAAEWGREQGQKVSGEVVVSP
jgi:STE24 endopeptidase